MEKNTISLIHQHLVYLNPALRRIAEYILANLEECKTITTKNLAQICDVAESSVTRLVKELGFGSFQGLKISIAEYLTKNEQTIDPEERVYEDIQPGDSTRNVVDKLVYRNTLALTDTQKTINLGAIEKAVDAIADANMLMFSSQGLNKVAASEAAIRFIRVGKQCLVFDDEATQLMVAACCGPKDVVIGISNSGRTSKVVQSVKLAKAQGATTIGITSNEDSPLAKAAEILLFTPTKSRGVETGVTWESASSKTAQILIFDVLCACYTLRQYKQSVAMLDATYKAIKSTRE